MSYILDAIRKAEQQRNQGQMPTLHSMGAYEERGSGKSALRAAGTVGIVLLLVAIAWFHRPILETLGSGISTITTSVSGMFAGQEVSDSPAPETESSSSAGTSTAETVAAADADTLAKVQFSVISYSSDPNKRFVMDGSKILREGDIINGFPIREIRKDSVVLDVNGQPRTVQY